MISLDVDIHNKTYMNSQSCVLKDVVFSARAGEFISFIGPSGTGKTTLLNIIGGLDKDFDGELFFNKKRLTEIEQPLSRAYMFQEPRLMPWLTVSGNISLVAGKGKTRQEYIKELLCEVELEDKADMFPLSLSGGMQRRVALARAFSVKPELLLLDEPFVSLDFPTANRLRNYLMSIWDKNKPTVIFVTHDLREAVQLSDRLLFLSKEPATIVKDYVVDITRPRRYEQKQIDDICNELLEQNPNLLSGDVIEGKTNNENLKMMA